MTAPKRPERHRSSIDTTSKLAAGFVMIGIRRHRALLLVSSALILLSAALLSALAFIVVGVFDRHFAFVPTPFSGNNHAFVQVAMGLHLGVFAATLLCTIALQVSSLSTRFMQHRHALAIPDLVPYVLIGALTVLTVILTVLRVVFPRLWHMPGIMAGYLTVVWLYVALRVLVASALSGQSIASVYGCVKRKYSADAFDDFEVVVKMMIADLASSVHSHSALDAFELVQAWQQYRIRSKQPDLEGGMTRDAGVADLDPKTLALYRRALRYSTDAYGLFALLLDRMTKPDLTGCGSICAPREHRRRTRFRVLSQIDDDDIIDGNFTPTVCLPAFICTVDRRRREVWISISGSCTVSDVLTDIRADAIAIDAPPGFEGGYAHAGIWTSAVNVHDRLRSSSDLAAFLGEHPDYRIMLTGHSLGAGTATALHLILQKHPLDGVTARPVRCVAFACPPIRKQPRM